MESTTQVLLAYGLFAIIIPILIVRLFIKSNLSELSTILRCEIFLLFLLLSCICTILAAPELSWPIEHYLPNHFPTYIIHNAENSNNWITSTTTNILFLLISLTITVYILVLRGTQLILIGEKPVFMTELLYIGSAVTIFLITLISFIDFYSTSSIISNHISFLFDTEITLGMMIISVTTVVTLFCTTIHQIWISINCKLPRLFTVIFSFLIFLITALITHSLSQSAIWTLYVCILFILSINYAHLEPALLSLEQRMALQKKSKRVKKTSSPKNSSLKKERSNKIKFSLTNETYTQKQMILLEGNEKAANAITEHLNLHQWNVLHASETDVAISIALTNFAHAYLLNLSKPTLDIDGIKEIVEIIREVLKTSNITCKELPIIAVHDNQLSIEAKKIVSQYGIYHFYEIPCSSSQIASLANQFYNNIIRQRKV